MKHHKTLLALATLAAAVLLGGCTDDTKPATGTPQTPKATASTTPSLPAKAPKYAMPANLCTAVSADAFADLAPSTPPQASERGRTQTARHTSSTCQLTLGKLDDTVLVNVGVDLFTTDFGAQGNYEGFRGVVFKDYPGARDITGVGTAAYYFTDPKRGPHLVVHFGNAHVGVSAAAIDASKPLPSDIETRLITTATTTLNRLPTA